MTYTIASVSKVDDRTALNTLLQGYFTVIFRKYLGILDASPPVGSSRSTSEDLMASIWPTCRSFYRRGTG